MTIHSPHAAQFAQLHFVDHGLVFPAHQAMQKVSSGAFVGVAGASVGATGAVVGGTIGALVGASGAMVGAFGASVGVLNGAPVGAIGG